MMLVTARGCGNIEGKGVVLVIAVRGLGVASFDMPVVVGPGIMSLVTVEGPCIASIMAWTIVGISLKVKGTSLDVEEAGKQTMVDDVLLLFDNWVDCDKGYKCSKVNQHLMGWMLSLSTTTRRHINVTEEKLLLNS